VNYLRSRPTAAPWRLRLNVQENLTGFADATARFKRGAEILAGQANSGMKSVLSPKNTIFGPPTIVFSDEVLAE
jgi:hypothetical protein